MDDVHKTFGATRALAGVHLEVLAGETLALIGENGAGKSTLMKILSGAHPPDRGAMFLDGAAYSPRNPHEARAAGVAMIYQELSLAPHLSVTENVLLGVEPVRGPWMRWGEARRRTTAALAEIGLGDLSPDVEVRRLSLAQQQMVEIARAVALECRVLVLDEPTSSLARRDMEQLFALINRLKARGIAVIYISHFLEEVQEIADRYAVLRDGASVAAGRIADATPRQLVAHMVGRNVEDLYPRSARPTSGETLLEMEGLSGADKPLDVGLQLRRGEVVGIAGLIGAGRTELLRTLFGLDLVVAGTVRVGTFTGSPSPRTRWAQGVGMVSEDRKREGLAQGLSIADNLTLPRLEGLGPKIPRCGRWRLDRWADGWWVLPSRQRTASARWIERLSIKCQHAGQAVGGLSGGNQQKVALARLLYSNVDVLLLDEPTRGIDVGSKAEIYRLIDDLAVGDVASGRAPKGVLMASSYLPELLGTCDRIAVMRRGRLVAHRGVAEWDERRLMLAATGQEEEDPR